MSLSNKIATRYLMAYFKPNEYILYGKFKNKLGLIKRMFMDNGVPKIEIEPVPKGRKKTRIMGLYTIRKAPPEAVKKAPPEAVKYV